MRTFTLRGGDIHKDWYLVDAEGQVLGRLASGIATVLRGKHKPTYSPHLDMGDFVIVTNAEKVKTTGAKESQKKYWRHTGFPGGLKLTPLEDVRRTHPDRIIRRAVKGMLPHNSLGRQLLRHLKVYAGAAHPHTAQQPKLMEL